jgi:predicted nucleic acid-binding protein
VLVVDASVIVAACLAADGWAPFEVNDLTTPPLGLSEACSVLHEARWREDLDAEEALAAVQRVFASPVTIQAVDDPLRAWRVADRLGWAKTYDAEYVALAQALDCGLVTLDERLRRGASKLVEIIGPSDLVRQPAAADESGVE